MQDTSCWPELEAFIRDQVACRPLGGAPNLSKSTRLAHDLGLTGLDGVEFIQTWQNRFGVDTSNFPYVRYFGRPGTESVGTVFGLILSHSDRPDLVPLTLGMLAHAIILGQWDTQAIEASSSNGLS